MQLDRWTEAYQLLSPYRPQQLDTADGVEIEKLLAELAPAGGRA
jgi:hypothetical protein